MSYTDNYSLEDEESIHKARKHWIIFVIPGFVSFYLLIMLLMTIHIGVEAYSINLIFLAAFAIPPFILRFTTELTLTNKRVSGKKGIIAIEAMDSPLDKINNVKIKQTILGRLLNYGTIEIDTASGSYLFKRMTAPAMFKKLATKSIDVNKEETMKRQAELIAASLK